MTTRAESSAATADRIVAAAVALFYERPLAGVVLEDVARCAGVSLQTVLRHFGSRDGLFAAAVRHESTRIRGQRDSAPAGDLVGAIRNLVAHYEDVGEHVLRLLAAEDQLPAVKEITDSGRAYHAAWCTRVFAPALRGLRGTLRQRRLAQLIAVTDVRTWQLLRHDRALTRRQTELALVELVRPLWEAN